MVSLAGHLFFIFYSSHLLLNVFPHNRVKKLIISIFPCSLQSAETTFTLSEIVSVTIVKCLYVKTPLHDAQKSLVSVCSFVLQCDSLGNLEGKGALFVQYLQSVCPSCYLAQSTVLHPPNKASLILAPILYLLTMAHQL